MCLLFLHARYDISDDESEMLRAALAIRQRTGDWFYRGRFRDDVGLTVDKPDILAKWFQRQDEIQSGALVNLCNFNQVAGAKATLMAKGLDKVTHAVLYTPDHMRRLCPFPAQGMRSGSRFRPRRFPPPC